VWRRWQAIVSKPGRLSVHVKRGAFLGPVEHVLRIRVREADAARGPGAAEDRPPVSAVDSVVAVEGHDPVDVGDVVTAAVRVHASEPRDWHFVLNLVVARWSRGAGNTR